MKVQFIENGLIKLLKNNNLFSYMKYIFEIHEIGKTDITQQNHLYNSMLNHMLSFKKKISYYLNE